MSTDRDVNSIVRSWLEEGATALPDRVLDAVLDQVPANPQRRAWWPVGRSPQMNNALRIFVAAAAVVVVALIALNLIPRSAGVAGLPSAPVLTATTGPTPAPSPSPSPSPTPSPTPSPASSPSEQPSPTTVAGPTTLAASDVGRTLTAGIYRVASPFGRPFTIALTSGWKFEALSRTAASFTQAHNESGIAPGIEVALAGGVYADPCHRGGPLRLPVPRTVDDMVESLTKVTGFTAAPDADGQIGDRAAKKFTLYNDYNSGNADDNPDAAGGCAVSRDLVWVVEVDGTPVVIRGRSYHLVPAGALLLMDNIESISFD